MVYNIGDTLTFYAQSTRFTTGEAYDAASPPTYRVYEEETGTPILTGTMALLDDAGTTGFYSEQIAVSSANGFDVNKDYCIRVAGTVDSVSAASIARQFRVVTPVMSQALPAEFTGNPATYGETIRRSWEHMANLWIVGPSTATLMSRITPTNTLVQQAFSYTDTGSTRGATT